MKKIYVVKVYSDSMDERWYIDSYWTKYEDTEKRIGNLLMERDSYEVDVKSIDDKSLLRGK